MKTNHLELANKILKKENKNLSEEINRLKVKNEMLEIIMFHLIRKEIFNEKS